MSNINKGGRPKKEVKRTKEKRILFTELEAEQIDKMFSESDYTNMNSMIRDILLKKKYRIVTFNNDARIQKNILIEEVRRIGNNFNQLMRSFNERKMDSFSKIEIEMLLKILAEIKEVFFKIEDIAKESYLPESRKPI
ncbi:hypothetical protein B0A75_20305 [Flavobacterium oncorhynchi]|uniref:Uncharacterized protein n=1 Tax=Flavobacterium oncorhynchi TaxID=728056 RepID=A0A226HFZ5_9FLAO|nr:plasmid mobilization relaxosome protein MobC [Flavobacterium oncorhynchi]OXA93193.1 hypothetical protein B0A75_20305 [Flavobacterium oncorhynchi]